MKNWYTSIYKALMIATTIAFILSFFTDKTISYSSILIGYSLLILSVMLILIILMKNIFKVKENTSNMNVLSSILLDIGPFILMLCVIGFILYLMIKYKNIIISGNILDSYYSFSNLIICLFLSEMCLLLSNMSTEKFEATGKLSKISSGLFLLSNVLTMIFSLIIFVILKYFTTDGFRTNSNNYNQMK